MRVLTPLVAREPYCPRFRAGIATLPASAGWRTVTGPEPSRPRNNYDALIRWSILAVKDNYSVQAGKSAMRANQRDLYLVKTTRYHVALYSGMLYNVEHLTLVRKSHSRRGDHACGLAGDLVGGIIVVASDTHGCSVDLTRIRVC